jgi:hypothetical protein
MIELATTLLPFALHGEQRATPDKEFTNFAPFWLYNLGSLREDRVQA